MRSLDLASQALRVVLRHPGRSFLTAATSAVAIAVTVNVISLVYGLDKDVRRDTSQFGRRTVDVIRLPVVAPGMKQEHLDADDLAYVRHLVSDLGATVVARRLAAGEASATGGSERVTVVATSPDYLSTLDVEVAAGRWLRPDDPTDRVAVIDASVASVLYPGLPLSSVPGRRFRLHLPSSDEQREVIGVLRDPLSHRDLFEEFDEGQGARALTSALLSFRNVYLPEDALGRGDYSGFSVVARRARDVDDVARRLRKRWPPGAKDQFVPLRSVGVFVRRDWMDLIGESSQAGAFLSNIVWIIIVGVAVVMVSTLNLLTIRERYGEFAVRRVEGAGKNEIAVQVMVEGTILALVGGLAGLPVGYLGAALLRKIVDFPFRFEARYALVATGIAVVLGLLASVLPARHAASLDPVRVLTRRPS